MIFAVVNKSGGTVSNIVVGEDIDIVTSIVGECVEQTEETGPAGIGYAWNGIYFIPSSPYPSWIWNEELRTWEAPTPMPEGSWQWDEDTISWVEVQ